MFWCRSVIERGRWMDIRMDGWIDGWMNEWMNEWIYWWMNGFFDILLLFNSVIWSMFTNSFINGCYEIVLFYMIVIIIVIIKIYLQLYQHDHDYLSIHLSILLYHIGCLVYVRRISIAYLHRYTSHRSGQSIHQTKTTGVDR